MPTQVRVRYIAWNLDGWFIEYLKAVNDFELNMLKEELEQLGGAEVIIIAADKGTAHAIGRRKSGSAFIDPDGQIRVRLGSNGSVIALV